MTYVQAGLTALALVLSAGASTAPSAQAEMPVHTTEAWQEDLDALLAELNAHHPNLHHTTSEAVWMAQASAYRTGLGEMSENERIVGMARLLAMVGDGHTWMPMHALPFDGLPEGPDFRSLPVRFELFDDGLYIVGATDPDLVGQRVETFGEVRVAEALSRVLEILPHDAVNFSSELAPEWLMQAELLMALGLSDEADAVRLTLTDGATSRTVTLAPLSSQSRYDWLFSMDSGPSHVDAWHTAAAQTPIWQTPMSAPVRLIEDVGGAPYIQVFSIADSDTAYSDIARQAAAITQSSANPVLILDLRRCLGGDGSLNPGFIDALLSDERLSEPGRIRVLTSRQTHSAAIMLLSRLNRRTGAVFFGQAAADRPNHYGETNIWVTPNTGLPLIHASEYYPTGHVGDTRRHHMPDIQIPYLYQDYAAGEDTVLAAALAYKP